ncbi:hypothetical protein CN918_27780 [Priestia megaterium]|nr:hypothetical protein CN918_27780 [Priestia megaterium]
MDYLDKNELFNIFLAESLDTLNELSTHLLELEKDRTNKDAVNTLFRSAHTLKGNSSTVYNTFSDSADDDIRLHHTKKMADVTHALENLIMEARDNDMEITPEHIDILFETEQILETLLALIESEANEEIDVTEISTKLLNAVLTSLETPEEFSPQNEKEEKDGITFKLDTTLEDDFVFASLSLIYREIEDKYPNVSFTPNNKDLEEGKSFDEVLVTVRSTESSEDIRNFIEGLAFVDNAHLLEDNRQLLHSTSPLQVESTNEPNTSSTEEAGIPQLTSQSSPPAENTQSTPTTTSPSPSKRVLSNTSLRVPINRIDEVLKHVSSLVILRNKLMNITKKLNDKGLFDVTDEMSQSIDFLQESVMKIRMTPLDQLFSRFPKDVRNLAKDSNKKVNFECIGGETEIDKSLLDEISKPLIHLIKNSIFHGLESEEERIAAGKNPEGLLRLSAKHEQNMVVLTVEDDGRGINLEAVKRKAIEKGILSLDKADKISKDEIVNFIFHPGLSTSSSVNTLAGRGVGMDAVRAVVEEMKGHIEVKTEDGKGTKTIINLPLTLAIIPAMLTKIEDKFFSIPISQVIEAVEIDASELRYVANKEVYILRNKEIPIIRLSEFFNLRTHREESERLKIVVLKSGNKTIGTTVDEFIELEDIVVKNIGEYLGNIRGIAGCNILGDGSISLIVDVNTITNSSKTNE